MSSDSILLLLTQIVTLVIALLGFWTARAAKADIAQVHVLINSRLSRLLELTEKSAHAEGRQEEKDHPS